MDPFRLDIHIPESIVDIVKLVRRFSGVAPDQMVSFLDHLEASDIGRRLARSTFWTLFGTLLSRGMNMTAMILVARLLGESEFGELGIIQSTMGMFQTLAGFGLGWAATKYVAEFRKSDPDRTGKIISLSILIAAITGGILSLLFFAAAPWLSEHALAAPHLSWPLQISSLILLFGSLTGTQMGVLAGFEAFDRIAKTGLVTGVLGIPFIVGGAWLHGVEGAVWGMIAGFVVNWLLNRQQLKKAALLAGVKISRTGCWQAKAILWDYSLPAILSGTLFQVANWAGSAMLVNRPGGYVEMGHYHAANQWFSALLFLPGVLGQAVIPVLSERFGEKDLACSRKVLLFSWKLNAAVVLPAVMTGCFCSPWIMSFYGEGFRAAWPTLVVTLIAAGIVAMQAPANQVISALAKMWIGLIINLSWSTAFVLSAAAMIDWGSLGLAVGRGIAYCLNAYWSVRLAYDLVHPKSIQPKQDYA